MNISFPTLRRIAWPWYTTRAQSQALLRLIAVATEENLALSPLLESWAADESGVQRRRLRRLAKLVSAGKPLADAIEEVPHVLRDEDLLAIRFDAKLGMRTSATRERVGESSGADRSILRNAAFYLGILIVSIIALGVFLQIEILPIMMKLMSDFSRVLPDVIIASQQLLSMIEGWWLVAALLLLAVLWLAFATRMGRRVRRAFFNRLLAPGSSWVSADVLRKLAVAARSGRPSAGVLSTLARYHFDPRMRQKLLFVRNEVEQGADVWQSLTAVGVLAVPDLRLLETSESVGNRPWVLTQLADVRILRAARRRDRLLAFLLPTIVAAMGLLVLFEALTVFLPLIELIRAL